jgi:hypothetical protein
MCDVCKAEGADFLFKNGPKKVLQINNLYKVFKNSIAPIKLCHIHSVELFHIGEPRFLKEHIDFARSLAMRSKSQAESSDSPFGL